MNNKQLNILPGEVVRAVCQHLLEDHEYPTYHGFSSLLVLARTSRVFHEHALDAIWHKLPGYGYLMFTMPQDAWTITMKEGTGSYHMKPSLSVVRLHSYLSFSLLCLNHPLKPVIDA